MADTPRKLRSQGPVDAPADGGGASSDHGPGTVEHELGFYASYHANKINKMIHFVCIPIIFWTAQILLAYIRLPSSDVLVLAPGLAVHVNGALAIITGYFLYYVFLEPVAALSFAPIGALMYLTATYLANFAPLSLPLRNTSGFPQPSSLPFALALHVGGWIAQFIGHGVFEKRAPALMTSLTQALVLAPFFVHIEMLFEFFNYRPDLHKGMINAAGKRIRDMNRAAKAKHA